MDVVGFIFGCIWLISFQIFLDKGNVADWFCSSWICMMFAISTIGFIAFAISQFKNKKNPLIDVSVIKDKNFFFGTLIQVVLMGAMMGSAAMLPSMLQQMMGYTAFLSGLSMMPRGAGCFIASVLSAALAIKFGEKPLVIMGLIILGLGSFAFGQINLNISLTDIALPNFFFGMGMVLGLIPLINLSCCSLRNDQLTNASSLQNLFKNIGAAVGTSIVTTCVSRFSQVHQHMLVGNLSETNPVFIERVQVLAASFSTMVDTATATTMAKTQLYGQLVQQAHLWAYIETFRWFAIASFAILPLMLFVRSPQKINTEK